MAYACYKVEIWGSSLGFIGLPSLGKGPNIGLAAQGVRV